MIGAYFLIATMVIIGMGPIAYEIYKKTFDFFNLKNPFIIYYIIQLGLSGIITFSTTQPSEIGLDPINHYTTYLQSLLLSNASLLAFQYGYYTRRKTALKIPIAFRTNWNSRKSNLFVLLLFIFGYLSLFLLLENNGGLGQFLHDREAFRAGGMIGQGILIFPCTSLITLAALIFFAKSTNKSKKIQQLISIAVLIASIFPAYLLGFRSAIALPVLQFMVLWNYGCNKIPPGKLFVLLTSVVIGFTLYGLSRQIPADLPIDAALVTEVLSENPEIAYSVILRSKGTEVLTSVISKLDQTGDYEFGWRGVLECLTIVFPKVLWEDKPMPASQKFTTYFFGEMLTQSRGYDLGVWGGISPTVVGELYWHFGAFGALGGLFLLGRIAKGAYYTLRKNTSNPNVLIMYSIFFTTFSMFAEAIQGYANALIMYVPFIILIPSLLGANYRNKVATLAGA